MRQGTHLKLQGCGAHSATAEGAACRGGGGTAWTGVVCSEGLWGYSRTGSLRGRAERGGGTVAGGVGECRPGPC